MTEPRETIDLNEVGVLLPTRDTWIDVPGSIFQVMTKHDDRWGVFYIRIHPDCMDRLTVATVVAEDPPELFLDEHDLAANHWSAHDHSRHPCCDTGKPED